MLSELKSFWFIIIFTLVGFIQSFGQTGTEPPPKSSSTDPKRIWQNDEYKIKLLLLNHWSEVPANSGEIALFMAPENAVFSIRAYHKNFPGTLDQTRKTTEASMKSQLSDYTLVSSKVRSICSLEIFDIIFQKINEPAPGVYRSIAFQNKMNSFIMSFSYLPVESQKYDKIIYNIIENISFY